MHVDLEAIIKTIGLLGVFALVFAESGLLIGFFLPGDSLLFTAGFLASQGYINIWLLAIGAFVAAVAGDSVGYYIGHHVGPRLFAREDSRLFNKAHLLKTQAFYEKHGGKTIVMARFLPIIRTFAPIVAGIGNMHYRTFLGFNILGGFLWAVGISVLGYVLGNSVPDIDRYLIPIIIGIIIIPSLPSIIGLLRAWMKK